jgi:phage terminase small subunit
MNARQKRFCEEYLIDLVGKEAARRAGYKPTSCETMSSKLLAKADVRAYIEKLKAERSKRTQITADIVIQELAKIGLHSIQDIINDDMSIVNLKKISRDKATAVVGIKVTQSFTGTGKKRTKTVQTEVKTADKVQALIHLGKHLGVFEKDNQQKSMKIKVTRK